MIKKQKLKAKFVSEQEKQRLLASGEIMSIAEASKYTPYSPMYLSLLVRKRKIPGFKINRDWLTTRQAVLAYVNKQTRKHQRYIEQASKIDRDGKETL